MKRLDPRPRKDTVLAGSRFVWPALSIFCVAFLVRLIHIWQIRRAPFFSVLMGDSRGYDTWARQIAAGDWLGRDVFYQAPLYPYFLGSIYTVAGHDALVVRICQAVLGSGACVLLGLAGARLFSRTAGVVAGLGLALYAPAIFFDSLLQKTVLDVFFVCLALYLMSRIIDARSGGPMWPPPSGPTRGPALAHAGGAASAGPRTWLFLGLSMGALALTRENAMVFVVVILTWALVGPQLPRHDARPEGRADSHNARPEGRADSHNARPEGRAYKRAYAVGGFLLGLAIVLVPVAIRNSVVGGGFYVTTSQFGPNFYLGNNASADGTAQSLRVGRGSAEYERQDAVELAEHAVGRRLTPNEVSQFWTDRALTFITAQPGAWLKLMARKFALLWNATEMLDTESQESYAEWSWPVRLGATFGHFGVLVPLALFGVWVTWPERRRLWVLYTMVAAYAASVLMFFIYARYRFPLVPFLMVFAAAGIAAALQAIQNRQLFFTGAGAPPPARSYDDASRQTARHGRRRSLAGAEALLSPSYRDASPSGSAWPQALLRWPSIRPLIRYRLGGSRFAIPLALLILTTVFTNWPVLSPALMRAITEHNLGAALQSDGRVDEAIGHYRRALALKADHAPALNNMGTALAAKGDVHGAIESYDRALDASPDYASAHYNLANALLQTGQPDKATDHFRHALESAPGSAEIHNNLGIALMDKGRDDEAIAEFRKALEFDPDSARTNRNLGSVLASAGRANEAIEFMRKAVTLDARDGPAHYDLATLLVEAGRLPEAVDEFRTALGLMPDSVEVLNNLGIALASLGQLDEAVGIFQRALSLQPGFAPAQRNLTAALQRRRQPSPRSRP